MLGESGEEFVLGWLVGEQFLFGGGDLLEFLVDVGEDFRGPHALFPAPCVTVV